MMMIKEEGIGQAFIRRPGLEASTGSDPSHDRLISTTFAPALQPVVAPHQDNRLGSHRRYEEHIRRTYTLAGLCDNCAAIGRTK
jgi:hypothetical protein